jgi:hypothetical protein
MADSGEIMRDYANSESRSIDQRNSYQQQGLNAFARFGETAVPNALAIQEAQQRMQIRDVQAQAELEFNGLQRQKLQQDLQFAAQLHGDDFMNLQKRKEQALVSDMELEVEKKRKAWSDEQSGYMSVTDLMRTDAARNMRIEMDGGKVRVVPLSVKEMAAIRDPLSASLFNGPGAPKGTQPPAIADTPAQAPAQQDPLRDVSWFEDSMVGANPDLGREQVQGLMRLAADRFLTDDHVEAYRRQILASNPANPDHFKSAPKSEIRQKLARALFADTAALSAMLRKAAGLGEYDMEKYYSDNNFYKKPTGAR